MHYHIKIKLYHDESADAIGFGRGIVSLLEHVEQTGSIKLATAKMGMAYSKAWKIIRKTEQEFGIALLSRNRHCGSVLTEDAKTFLAFYHQMLQAAQSAVHALFAQKCEEEKFCALLAKLK